MNPEQKAAIAAHKKSVAEADALYWESQMADTLADRAYKVCMDCGLVDDCNVWKEKTP